MVMTDRQTDRQTDKQTLFIALNIMYKCYTQEQLGHLIFITLLSGLNRDCHETGEIID